jgi:hypothetical protein
MLQGEYRMRDNDGSLWLIIFGSKEITLVKVMTGLGW